MNVYWLEQREADIPKDNDWLSASEMGCLEGFRFSKRRNEWRLGRWTAKRAVASYLQLSGQNESASAIEIHPAPSGAPEVFIAKQRAPITISLSHRSGSSICAVSVHDVRLGCDLETIEPHSDAFIRDYFTDEEQDLIVRANDPALVSALLWSAKESALKALHEGLRLDTRDVAVNFERQAAKHKGWHRLCVEYGDAAIFRGWWRETDDLVRTVAADPAPEAPIWLTPARLC